jgi:VIT1/CCC1 family predicted Fe2+/Mn2+ transporter
MVVETNEASRSRQMGWGVGLLLIFVTVQVGVVLPAVAIFVLSRSSGLAVPAMVGGFLTAWTTLIAGLRVGRQRGWWA